MGNNLEKISDQAHKDLDLMLEQMVVVKIKQKLENASESFKIDLEKNLTLYRSALEETNTSLENLNENINGIGEALGEVDKTIVQNIKFQTNSISDIFKKNWVRINGIEESLHILLKNEYTKEMVNTLEEKMDDQNLELRRLNAGYHEEKMFKADFMEDFKSIREAVYLQEKKIETRHNHLLQHVENLNKLIKDLEMKQEQRLDFSNRKMKNFFVPLLVVNGIILLITLLHIFLSHQG